MDEERDLPIGSTFLYLGLLLSLGECADDVNLALRKPVWQSSTSEAYTEYYGFDPVPDFAVDGHRWTMYWDGSCTHTYKDPTPWFTVDLLLEYRVTEVVVTNRGDCCAERLADFTVAVGSSFDPDRFDPTGFTTCAHVEGHLDTSETRTIQCDVPVSGRYVTLYLTQKMYLTLCELEVHGYPVVNSTDSDLSNIALGKQAWQSSTYDHSYVPTANKAVDGNPASNFTYQSCTHTNEEYQPWWAVDLGGENLVSEVVITNRGDCCEERLADFTVSVGYAFDPNWFDPSSFNTCARVSGHLEPGETRTIPCTMPMFGQYVVIQLESSGVLTLCEVEVRRLKIPGRPDGYMQESP